MKISSARLNRSSPQANPGFPMQAESWNKSFLVGGASVPCRKGILRAPSFCPRSENDSQMFPKSAKICRLQNQDEIQAGCGFGEEDALSFTHCNLHRADINIKPYSLERYAQIFSKFSSRVFASFVLKKRVYYLTHEIRTLLVSSELKGEGERNHLNFFRKEDYKKPYLSNFLGP